MPRWPVLVLLCCAVTVAACTGVREIPAAPKPNYIRAEIPGYSTIRVWGDEDLPDAGTTLREIRNQIAARSVAEGAVPNDGRFDVLVLSGGGSDGAYGAGLLNGWSARGDRPEFGLVTGISTGAIIAPFAFLGSDYDDDLERFYTTTRTENLLTFQPVLALFGYAQGLADTTGFEETIDRALTPQMVVRIAEEHAKGRRLWIGTTNLDAQRPVIWDIGRIASSGNPDARRLIGQIILASAAIPGALPPVQFRVRIDGRSFTEMHVDGGVTRQLFLYPSDVSLAEQEEDQVTAMRLGTIYAIRNTKLDPDYVPTDAGILPIAARSISTLIKAAGVADVAVLTEQARRDGFGLKLTAVPESFEGVESELFDPVYMRGLYEIGYALAVDGLTWTEAVPTRP